ncbi:MAG: DUF1156 domain-containing protein [Pirellulaceae bacterium]
MPDDLRLIEDYLPIEAISAEASREKSVRKGHISTLHLWWARRPLVACRAAVYGALVSADRWVKDVNLKNPPEDAEKATKSKNGKKKGLNRKAAKEFVTKLCRYPKTNPTKEEDVRVKRETEAAIVDAQRHILEAHADRLTAELAEAKKKCKPPAWALEFKFTGERVSYDDIVAGRAPRPRVLDMFAGGGAIPLEALRLGCEAYALDLNPVAHIIQLCTLVYPQKYGKPDPNARGMTGPKNAQGETTWGGLAEEVRYWGNWVLDRVHKEIGDLYPPIPDPEVWAEPPDIAFDCASGAWSVVKAGKLKRGVRLDAPAAPASLLPDDGDDDAVDDEINGSEISGVPALPPGYLQPVAYLWTRTVRCKNPRCGATVPLVKQTWLCKKPTRYAALKLTAPSGKKVAKFEVVDSRTEKELGFDPAAFSKGGNATCPFCGTVADVDYVKDEGWQGRMGCQSLATVGIRRSQSGKVYIAADSQNSGDAESTKERLSTYCRETGATVPSEPIANLPADCRDNTLGITVRPYGLRTFGDLYSSRQLLSLLAFCRSVSSLSQVLAETGSDTAHSTVVATCLGVCVSRLADFNSAQCTWFYDGGRGVKHAFGRQTLAMVWDYAETNPLNAKAASWQICLNVVCQELRALAEVVRDSHAGRASALHIPEPDGHFDAVITDPPYYDNVPYADIADYFYVWLKRSIGSLYPEHFSTICTPKKEEIIADARRCGGNKNEANKAYERMMAQAFGEARRVLKDVGALAIVYAHKTTLGWATLVDALRRSGLIVVEAWPLDTENSSRLRAMESSALASSIFLVARKRAYSAGAGNYEDDVQPELQQIVRERVETLWEMGIAGADLVIACVGAGLRAFTKYERVEYANGEEVPAERFLAEVEGVVLDTMMGKLFGQAGAKVSAIDPASRFYILWRFVYKASEIEAGEAIVFTYAQHVELDGPLGLSTGKAALVEKKKAKYRARDFTERGDNDNLGLPGDGLPAPLIDVLHRALWLLEHSPRKLSEFLIEADPDRERLRLLAQALVGAALSGKSEEDASKLIGTTPAERSALGKLLANWKAVIEHAVVSPAERSDKKAGQKRLGF